MPQTASLARSRRRSPRLPLALLALFFPAVLFGIGLILMRHHPRYAWISSAALYPWEFWAILASGLVATTAGALDWKYHRSGKVVIGRPEHQSELAALAVGAGPLFALMAAASVIECPQVLLLPILVFVLFTTVLICYDEFVFHRKRCGVYETLLHRLLVFGNGIAWLVWMHWCFVRREAHG